MGSRFDAREDCNGRGWDCAAGGRSDGGFAGVKGEPLDEAGWPKETVPRTAPGILDSEDETLGSGRRFTTVLTVTRPVVLCTKGPPIEMSG
jgi:hypothetical protein